jgi:dihydroorotase
MINRNHIFKGGIRPHYFCLPIAKRQSHQLALREAATSGEASFFLGTDSAPHLDGAKESACGCAGVYNAPNTLSCLAHVFEEEGRLDQLEAFASLNGPAFYRLLPNNGTVTLEKRPQPVQYAPSLQTAEGAVTVFDPECDLHWHIV